MQCITGLVRPLIGQSEISVTYPKMSVMRLAGIEGVPAYTVSADDLAAELEMGDIWESYPYTFIKEAAKRSFDFFALATEVANYYAIDELLYARASRDPKHAHKVCIIEGVFVYARTTVGQVVTMDSICGLLEDS